MSTEQDPPRLLDDPSVVPSLRAALEEAQAVAPGPAALGAVGSGVARAVRGAALKKVVLALVVAGAGLGAVLMRPAGAPVESALLRDAGAVEDADAGAVEDVDAGAVGDAQAADASPVDQAPTLDAGATRTTRPRAVPTDTGPPAVAAPLRDAPARPEEEIVLLERAESALGNDPAAALALTQILEQQYPQGALAQEREAIAIEALAKLGRREEAQVRLRRFLAAHPESPHRMRLERL